MRAALAMQHHLHSSRNLPWWGLLLPPPTSPLQRPWGAARQAESCPWQVAHALGWPRALRAAGAALQDSPGQPWLQPQLHPLQPSLAAGAVLPCPSDGAQGSPALQHILPESSNGSRTILTVTSVLSWVSFRRSLQV